MIAKSIRAFACAILAGAPLSAGATCFQHVVDFATTVEISLAPPFTDAPGTTAATEPSPPATMETMGPIVDVEIVGQDDSGETSGSGASAETTSGVEAPAPSPESEVSDKASSLLRAAIQAAEAQNDALCLIYLNEVLVMYGQDPLSEDALDPAE